MSVIGKWALQAVIVFLFAWLATVTAQWGSSIVRSTGSDRLAASGNFRMSSDSVAVSVNKKAEGNTVVTAALGQGNE